MPQINVAKREISCKVVYCGPGLSGKTTNIEVVHKKAPRSATGELTSIATEGDRTLFFDYMPLDLGKVGGLRAKLQLYTVPGQEYYNATRRLVLQGVDGVVFVADSQPDKLEETIRSLKNLEDNLREQGLELAHMPLVIQWNKRDLPGVLSVEELERKVNHLGAPTVEAVAVMGVGVLDTLKKITKLTLEKVSRTFEEPPGERAAREALRQGKAFSGHTPRREGAPEKSARPPAAETPAPEAPAPEAPARETPAPQAPRGLAPAPVNRPSSTRRRTPAPVPTPEPVAVRAPEPAPPASPLATPAPPEPRPAARIAVRVALGILALSAALAAGWALARSVGH